ncbi:hypothetical protein D3C81_169140 [compost metagenome]|jgi:hypothetical protein
MNRRAHEVQTRWLESRQPSQRTGNEAITFRTSAGRVICGWLLVRPSTTSC